MSAKDTEGRTALHVTCQEGNLHVVKVLLDRGKLCQYVSLSCMNVIRSHANYDSPNICDGCI